MASFGVFCVCVVALLLSFSLCVFSGVLKEELYDFDFITRDEWNALPSKDKRPINLPVPYVVVHHTYIPGACYHLEACAKTMRSMQNYHNSLNWGDIGYNFCVGTEGSAFEGRGWNVKGIHAGLANNHSIGICMIGDWKEELPPEKTMNTLKGLIREGVLLGKIRKDYKLIGHMQASSTECPGAALMKEISHWKHFTPGYPDFGQMTMMRMKMKRHKSSSED